MFEFALVWAWLLLPLPWIVRLLLPSAAHTQAPLALPKAARFIGPRQVRQPALLKRWLLPTCIWLALVATLAQPRWLGEPVTVTTERREMMIALDLSGSMQADDMTYNGRQVTRLQAAHHILAEFIERRQGDRIGLIVYADNAYVYSPLTRDLNALAQLAREAQIGLAGQRTALGDAIALSISTMHDSESEPPVVLMLTDGMINTGQINAEQALRLAANSNVRMHTIGIGSDEMIVQGLFGERRIDPSAEMDEDFLRAVAQSTGGQYFRARNEQEMRDIYRLIDELEPIADDSQRLRPQTSLAHWPMAFGFGLLLSALALRLWRHRRHQAQLTSWQQGE
ncbi:VWA domain-containing protein [Aliidiomarina maris]|uniref:Ca-activated chloride channel family protein n=1 Tax=Aliidiomarina maris TaxID=531312 RepID=A0A327WWL1_9GAMM|nr:VWA domain-containing protein [Aliidiomarina maris]RAJ96870.1 Ca-activated chloride channel family protein [Aliidiomarina maris]RUO24191.1 IMP dehydrogenase [Aliidiomarina maris]